MTALLGMFAVFLLVLVVAGVIADHFDEDRADARRRNPRRVR